MQADIHAFLSKQDESTIIERVAHIVSSVRGTKSDYTHLAAELAPAIPFDLFGVALLRYDREAVRVTVCTQGPTGWVANYHQHPLKDSKIEQILITLPTLSEDEQALIITNYRHGLDGLPANTGDALSGHHYLHATLVAPLMVRGRLIGSLELGSMSFNIYADASLQRLIKAVAHVLAAAIGNAQTEGSVAIQDRQRQALKDISQALTAKQDLNTILQRIVAGIAQALDVASAIVTLLSPQGETDRTPLLRLQGCIGLDPHLLEHLLSHEEALNDQTIIGYSLRHRQPTVSHDLASDERFPASRPFATQLNIHSLISYPLIVDDTPYGALLLCSPEVGGFTPLKSDILALFASQATIAISINLLHSASEQRRHFQEAIEQLEQAHAENEKLPLTPNEEYILFQQLREKVEQTFGIHLESLLRFVGDHLLTQNEHPLQAILSATRAESQAENLTLLMQTTEAVAARGLFSSPKAAGVPIPMLSDHPDAQFTVDLNGHCIYFNRAAEILCGVSTSKAAGHLLGDIFAHLLLCIRNADEVRNFLYTTTQDNGRPPHELRCVLAHEPVHRQVPMNLEEGREGSDDGIVTSMQRSLLLESAPLDHHYQLSWVPLTDAHGHPLANLLRMHDITEQVRDEKNKSALLSSVSHDLRTPLTTIKAAVTGLLQLGVEWDEQTRRDILEEIDAEADHLTALVNALVEMSRIEMGALILEKEWCDIVELVHGTLNRLERLLAGRPVRVQVSQDLPLPLVQADYVQLERVLYNLLDNAMRHSPTGAEILITLHVEENMLQVRVIDHGEGVPEAERERIFRTFYSLDSHGNGLGLAICQGIVAAHQGRIWVETAESRGSCFVFTLPLHPTTIGGGNSSNAEHGTRMKENFTQIGIFSTEEVAS